MAAAHPALRDPVEFAIFARKWEFLFAYAGAGFVKGYISSHMLTFTREVRPLISTLHIPLTSRQLNREMPLVYEFIFCYAIMPTRRRANCSTVHLL